MWTDASIFCFAVFFLAINLGCKPGLNLIDIDEDADADPVIAQAPEDTISIIEPVASPSTGGFSFSFGGGGTGSGGGSVSLAPAPPLLAHDPARMVQDGAFLVFYYSGLEYISFNLQTREWDTGVGDCEEDWCILRGESRPEWITERLGNAIDGNPIEVGAAPGMDGPRTIYYSVTDWELDNGSACIGRATATGVFPNLEWVDDGAPVLCSTADSVNSQGDTYAIDPAIFEGFDDTLWMVYGSHYSGIYVIELDPETGHLRDDLEEDFTGTASNVLVASNPLDEDNGDPERIAQGLAGIEAAFVYPHDGYYYLFVNWGACCNGADSTYSIRVGRSEHPTGPFLDQDDIPLLASGGTPLIETNGSEVGPGHAGVTPYRGTFLFTYHYYDADNQGVGTLGHRELIFNDDGWPVLGTEPFLY